jgi:hypothetical protein
MRDPEEESDDLDDIEDLLNGEVGGREGDEDEPHEVPEGAAVFPEIPAELGVDPLLLAVVHATVFLAGSTEDVVNGSAADEAVERLGEYLRRLDGERLRRTREDMACLVGFARHQKWSRQLIQSLKSFLEDFGVGTEGES